MSTLYTPVFYDDHRASSLAGARAVVPILTELTACRSVLDLGCGTGTWLHEFQELGITDLMGVDGPYVQDENLEIPLEKFVRCDLQNEDAIPVTRTFDLALCLEVAEHLTAQRGLVLVETLAKAAPYVCFSAAIPHQDGTGHISGQWQDYWVKMFEKFGFVAFDVVRPHLWEKPEISYWYAQNIILYVRRDVAAANERLSVSPLKHPISIVHPQLFTILAERLALVEKIAANPGLGFLLANLPKALWRGLARKLGKEIP